MPLLIFFLVLLFASVCPAQLHDSSNESRPWTRQTIALTPLTPINLPRGAQTLLVEDSTLYASLGLEGFAIIPLKTWAGEESAPGSYFVYANVMAMDVLPLPGLGVDSADSATTRSVVIPSRESELLFFTQTRAETSLGWEPLGAPNSVFPVEGIPIRVAARGKLLAVACGGAGVSLLERTGEEPESVRLVGRFPFPEFARDVAFLSPTRLAVVDTQASVVYVLNVADARVVHRIQVLTLPGGGFTDEFARYHTPASTALHPFDGEDPRELVLNSRHGSFYRLVSNPDTLEPLLIKNHLPLPDSTAGSKDYSVLQMLRLEDGKVLTLERTTGLVERSAPPSLNPLKTLVEPAAQLRRVALWKNGTKLMLICSEEGGTLQLSEYTP
ncbi:MAG: hypothetical protein SFY68_02385 [Candidatus Sumerlaeia bacterium]|nr:hypothetical protein [Candidatus Sumerlaeia bacterium]